MCVYATTQKTTNDDDKRKYSVRRQSFATYRLFTALGLTRANCCVSTMSIEHHVVNFLFRYLTVWLPLCATDAANVLWAKPTPCARNKCENEEIVFQCRSAASAPCSILLLYKWRLWPSPSAAYLLCTATQQPDAHSNNSARRYEMKMWIDKSGCIRASHHIGHRANKMDVATIKCLKEAHRINSIPWDDTYNVHRPQMETTVLVYENLLLSPIWFG